MSIEDWRSEIDGIDDHLLHLINRRALLALRIGELKRSAGHPEARCLMLAFSGVPAVTRLFRFIIRESRRMEADLATTNQSGNVKVVHD